MLRRHRFDFLPRRAKRSFVLLLAVLSTKASAAGLGSLATSFGLFAALAALLTLNNGSGPAPSDVMSLTGVVVALGVGVGLTRHARRRSSADVVASSVHSGAVCRSRRAAATLDPVVKLPAEFDRADLLATAQRHFVQLQAAWDVGDLAVLGTLTTRDLLEDLSCQLPERGLEPNRTDVLMLDAVLLGFDELDSAYLMSVEFSGMIRERSDQGPVAFRELWLLTRLRLEASTWRLARQQALL